MTKLSPATEALLSAEHEVPEGQSLEHECAITLFWQSYRLGRFRQCQHDLGSMWGAGLRPSFSSKVWIQSTADCAIGRTPIRSRTGNL